MDMDTVQRSVNENLCISCGICKSICPKQSIVYYRQNGLFLPKIDSATCVSCGICAKICPGLSIDYSDNGKQVPLQTAARGPVIEAFVTYSNDSELRHRSASGGTIMTIVRKLLDDGIYAGAFCVSTYDYQSQVKTTLLRDTRSSEFLLTSKSRYLPVSHENAVSYMRENPTEKLILIGTPCAISGLKKVIDLMKLNRDNYLIIGLFCERLFNYNIYNYFASKKFSGEKKLVALHFKNKESGGWPGNLKLFYEDGTAAYFPSTERTNMKTYFQPERCLYCIDKLNVNADISLGDNYTGENDSSLGSNSIIIRTARGRNAFQKCREYLEVYPSSIEKVEEAQAMDIRIENYFSSTLKDQGIIKGIKPVDGIPPVAYWDSLKKVHYGAHYDTVPRLLTRKIKIETTKHTLLHFLKFPQRIIRKSVRLLVRKKAKSKH